MAATELTVCLSWCCGARKYTVNQIIPSSPCNQEAQMRNVQDLPSASASAAAYQQMPLVLKGPSVCLLTRSSSILKGYVAVGYKRSILLVRSIVNADVDVPIDAVLCPGAGHKGTGRTTYPFAAKTRAYLPIASKKILTTARCLQAQVALLNCLLFVTLEKRAANLNLKIVLLIKKNRPGLSLAVARRFRIKTCFQFRDCFHHVERALPTTGPSLLVRDVCALLWLHGRDFRTSFRK